MRGHHRERAQAIVLIALMMAVLVGFVALAIDSARAFDARRVLQDATDAAALAGATSYQAGHGWTTAETDLFQLFERDVRIAPGELCSPTAFAIPAAGGTATITCNLSGAAGYQLTVTATDGGPSGQVISLLARRPLVVALMQVLGGVPTLTIQAAGAATANELARTPALGGLSYDNTCAGGSGATASLRIQNKTNFATVTGDVASNGSLNLDNQSFLHLAGNVLTRCAAPVNPDHITYECWKSGATPPCSGSDVAGQLLSTADRLADPGYLPPGHPAGNQGIPGSSVILSPGIYTANPNLGSGGPCYFLAGGVYEWQGGLSINSGTVSNELKPPAEPVPGGGQQFWQHANCHGDFSVTAAAGPNPLQPGSYSVVVTSLRTDVVNGTTYTRESVPSVCKSVTVAGGDIVKLTISNVPGAANYNLYTTGLNGNCTGTFNLVSGTITAGAESNATVSGCPSTTSPYTNCTLGHPIVIYDNTATTNAAVHPPVGETTAFAGGLPYQDVARAPPPGGDLANENHCANPAGVSVACPAAGTPNVTTNFVTPGAVLMYVNSSTCLNLTAGDAFLFSGYQYDWMLNYEPPTTTCTNSWNGVYNSAAIGMSYTPGAAFNITGDGGTFDDTWSLEAPMGGIVAATIHIANSSGLVVDWDPNYAPVPGGPRLTG